MSVSLTLEQTTRIEPDDDGNDTYIVENTVVASQNISMSIFVYKTSTSEYHHMATQTDLVNYPETQAEALASNLEYYRQPMANRTYTDVYLAKDFASVVAQRANGLVQDVARTVANFATGTQTYTYTAGT